MALGLRVLAPYQLEDSWFIDNTVSDNRGAGMNFAPSTARNNTLERNTVTGNGNSGIFLGRGVTGFVIRNNRSDDNRRSGIGLGAGATGHRIELNSMHGNGTEDPALYFDATGNLDLYLAGTDAASPTRLTDDPADDMQPNFAPDGARIAFTSTRENGSIRSPSCTRTGPGRSTSRAAPARAHLLTGRRRGRPRRRRICPADTWSCVATLTGGIYAVNSDGSPGVTVISDGGGQFDPGWGVAATADDERDGALMNVPIL